MGRFRVIDFPISNMTNSGIDRIQVYVRRQPRSLVEHLGTGRHYSINSKKGRLHILFADSPEKHDIYNTDIAAFLSNMESIEEEDAEYVVIAPSYMVYSMDYKEAIDNHIKSGADISLVYHSVDNAKTSFLNCMYLNLNKQKGVLSIENNHGNVKNRNIFMETYIMKKSLFIELVKGAKKLSEAYTLADMVHCHCEDLDVRGIPHKGYFASITDFESFYHANMDLIDYKTAKTLFCNNWPIYTRTNDSCPTQYYEGADVKKSVISNGCTIEGTIINSIIGRGCKIEEGAVVKNSVILPESVVGKNAVVENQVVDKHAKILHEKNVVSTPEHPGYIKRGSRI